jgi:hypothetical protein
MNKKLLQESTENAIKSKEEAIKLDYISNIANVNFNEFLSEINDLALIESRKGKWEVSISCEKYFPIVKDSVKFMEFLGETIEHFTDYTFNGMTVTNNMWALRFGWK